jgi:hypothetical protein
MIYQAILIACLVSEPTTCRTHEIMLSSPMPAMQWMEAQTRAAEWLQKHPDMVKQTLKVLPGRGA